MVADKRLIRKIFINKREALSEEERRELSQRIVKNLLSLGALERANTLLMFCPHRGEPDITPLFSWALSKGKRLALPKVEGNELKLLKVKEDTQFVEGAFCIREPAEGEEVQPQEVDLALVPGIAFDRQGYRIGYGRGYYDRLLGKLGGLKVGVCYQFQLLEEVPRDSWDVPVDLVVTEEKTYEGGKERWVK